MQLQINSGIERVRILQWLEQELGLVAVQEGVYQLDGCTITLQPLPPGVLLNIQRTLVVFTGEETACRMYQKNFRLRFLSAGG